MRKRTIHVLVVCAFTLTPPTANAIIHLNDGLTHNINYEVSEDIWVDYDTPSGIQTTVNFLPGAMVLPDVVAFKQSKVNVSGGWLNSGLTGYSSSELTMSSGHATEVQTYNSSHATITEGASGWLITHDNSIIDFSGGEITVSVWSTHSSKINISGGNVGNEVFDIISARDYSEIIITGGNIFSTLLAGYNMYGPHSSVITIRGSGFNYAYGEIPITSGILTGTLENGDPISSHFEIYDNAKIVLIPEPATLLLLGFGAVVLRKRLNSHFRGNDRRDCFAALAMTNGCCFSKSSGWSGITSSIYLLLN